jgi:thioredoxin reductase
LSSALLLRRYIRSTIIFDGGKPRNYTSKHLHGYLGFENSFPNRVMQKAWNDILQYNSIKVIRKKVVKVENNSGLSLSTESANNLIRSIYLLIATGVEDSKQKLKTLKCLTAIEHGIVLTVMGLKPSTRNLAS